MENDNNYPLNTNWCLWYHSINNTSWSNKSYKLLVKKNYQIKALKIS